jgi:hypothetical protein
MRPEPIETASVSCAQSARRTRKDVAATSVAMETRKIGARERIVKQVACCSHAGVCNILFDDVSYPAISSCI